MKFGKEVISGIFAAVLFSSSAQAVPVYDFENAGNFPQGNTDAGELYYLHSQYTEGGSFIWDFTIGEVDGELSDAFYLVVNDGPNPTVSNNELAIIYADVKTGSVSVYDYDGVSLYGSSYLNPNGHIASFENAVSYDDTATTRRVYLNIDTAPINSLDRGPSWEGIAFNESLGFWFHPLLDSSISYDGSGKLTDFSGTLGWFDYNDQPTSVVGGEFEGSEVPEPSTVALLLLGLTGLAIRKKRS